MVDVPLYRGLGLSLGLEYSVPVLKVDLDIEPKFSGFGKVYYNF
jgi:hypothetical protein